MWLRPQFRVSCMCVFLFNFVRVCIDMYLKFSIYLLHVYKQIPLTKEWLLEMTNEPQLQVSRNEHMSAFQSSKGQWGPREIDNSSNLVTWTMTRLLGCGRWEPPRVVLRLSRSAPVQRTIRVARCPVLHRTVRFNQGKNAMSGASGSF